MIYKDTDLKKIPNKNKKSKRFGVIGNPIAHSMSSALHKEFFSLTGVTDAEYLTVQVEDLKDSVDLLKEKFDGFNVTVPYKVEIMKYLDVIDGSAKKIGAVNTVVVKDGKATGYNTDVDGFSATLEMDGIDVKDRDCLIIGYGGASKAVACALSARGANIFVTGRDEDKIDSFIAELDAAGIYATKDVAVKKGYHAVINATPVGMSPKTDATPVDADKISDIEYYFDLIYNPRRTKLMRQLDEKGIKTRDGLLMLVIQGAVAEKHFLKNNINVRNIVETHLRIAGKMLKEKLEKAGKKDIIFIGFMGSGKTTIAMDIGRYLDMQVVDLDAVIANKYGSISGIFDKNGEEYFRNIEHKTLKECVGKGIIISTGGGIVENSENKDMLTSPDAFVIYLNCDFEIIRKRVKGSDRPLFRDEDKAYELYKKRDEKYREVADHVVDSDFGEEETVKAIFGY